MPARHAPLRVCRQDFVCLLYERRLPFKRAGPRSSCWNALEATARRGYVAPRKVGDHWTEHRHGRATSTLITLRRTLRTMGITWCILCRSLRLMPLRPRSSLRARAQLPHHVCPAWAVAISGKKKQSSIAALLICEKRQVKCDRRVAWGRTLSRSRSRRSPLGILAALFFLY